MQNQTLNYTETSKIPERLSAGWNALVYPAQNGVRLLYQLYLPAKFRSFKAVSAAALYAQFGRALRRQLAYLHR